PAPDLAPQVDRHDLRLPARRRGLRRGPRVPRPPLTDRARMIGGTAAPPRPGTAWRTVRPTWWLAAGAVALLAVFTLVGPDSPVGAAAAGLVLVCALVPFRRALGGFAPA